MLVAITANEAQLLAEHYARETLRWNPKEEPHLIKRASDQFNFWQMICVKHFCRMIPQPVGFKEQVKAIS